MSLQTRDISTIQLPRLYGEILGFRAPRRLAFGVGVRKALGATSRNVQWQFFSEGLLLTLMSGTIGLGAGVALCKLVNLLPLPARFSGMIITWQTAAFAIGVLALIGIAAATYPARRAADMPPIEALRYEM